MSQFRVCLLPWLLLFVSGGVAAAERAAELRNVDPRANPCADFWQYANGGWLKAHSIPYGHSRWGIDDELAERMRASLKTILESAAAQHAAPGGNTQILGDFYFSALDQTARNKAGIGPLHADLAAIDNLKSTADVAGLLRDWQARGIESLFQLVAVDDLQVPGRKIAYALAGGLGLPARGYTSSDQSEFLSLRDRYTNHIAELLALGGQNDARAQAFRVLALETRLAKASAQRDESPTLADAYHPLSIDQADALTSRFSWSALFSAVGRADVRQVSLSDPEFFRAFDRALGELPVTHWQAYLRWRLIKGSGPYLSQALVDADFAFERDLLHRASLLKPRWRRALDATGQLLGDALGREYVRKHFPPSVKFSVLKLVNNIRSALRAQLEQSAWLSAAAKDIALSRLDALRVKVGHPDEWPDYSRLAIGRGAYLDNVRAIQKFHAQQQADRYDRASTHDQWDLSPQAINAYYNAPRNEIVVPAGQLQPPYFDLDADDARNYAAIGALIGHELIHAVDPDDRASAAPNGPLYRSTDSETARRAAMQKKLLAQYSAYVTDDKQHVDAQATLVENTADVGGLRLAYDAFKLSARNRVDPANADLSADRRFFLSFAQSWAIAVRARPAPQLLPADRHAPAKFRVIGALMNLPAFATAFACKPGDPMALPENEQVQLW
jgi:putative endopeptidase